MSRRKSRVMLDGRVSRVECRRPTARSSRHAVELGATREPSTHHGRNSRRRNPADSIEKIYDKRCGCQTLVLVVITLVVVLAVALSVVLVVLLAITLSVALVVGVVLGHFFLEIPR